MLFSKKQPRAVAVSFVSGSAAGCAIVGIEKKSMTVIAYALEQLPITTEPTKELVIPLIASACTKASQQYALTTAFKRFKAVKKSYGILYAPWAQSSAARADTHFQSDVVITNEHITKTAQQVFSQSSDNRFESTVILVELNGYPTRKPKGKKAHILSVGVLLSTGEPTMHEGMRSALVHAFPAQPQLRSDTRTVLATVSDELRENPDALIVHVSSESTRCVVVRRGVPLDIDTVTVGTRAIARKVSTKDDAMTLIHLAAQDMCTTDVCTEIQTALAKAEPDFAKQYGDVFAKISKQRKIPHRLILVAHPDFIPWLKSFFGRIDFAPFTITGTPFTVITPEHIEHSPLVWSAGLKEEVAFVETLAFVHKAEQEE